eukprot:1429488-Pleurochrysis_carterae.AAC.1
MADTAAARDETDLRTATARSSRTARNAPGAALRCAARQDRTTRRATQRTTASNQNEELRSAERPTCPQVLLRNPARMKQRCETWLPPLYSLALRFGPSSEPHDASMLTRVKSTETFTLAFACAGRPRWMLVDCASRWKLSAESTRRCGHMFLSYTPT